MLAMLALGVGAAACSRSEEAEPVQTGPGLTGSTTGGAATTGDATGNPPPSDAADVVVGPDRMLLRDRAGDTTAEDLDIVEATLRRRGPRLEATILVSAPPQKGSIYSTVIQCRSRIWQLALVRSRDGDVPFLAEVTGSARLRAQGSVAGTKVSIAAPVRRIPCARGPFSFRFVVERTGSGARMTDALPHEAPIPFRQ